MPLSQEEGNISQIFVSLLLRGGSLVGLIALSAAFAILSPYFFTLSNWLNIFRQVAVVLIVASAQTMVIIAAGIDLSVGPLLALGGCLAAVAMSYWGWPFLSGALLGVFFATMAGFANGVIIAKGKIPDFIATLGMLGAVRGIALLITGGFRYRPTLRPQSSPGTCPRASSGWEVVTLEVFLYLWCLPFSLSFSPGSF